MQNDALMHREGIKGQGLYHIIDPVDHYSLMPKCGGHDLFTAIRCQSIRPKTNSPQSTRPKVRPTRPTFMSTRPNQFAPYYTDSPHINTNSPHTINLCNYRT